MNVNANVKYVEHKNNELMKEAICEGMLAQRQRLGPESSLYDFTKGSTNDAQAFFPLAGSQ